MSNPSLKRKRSATGKPDHDKDINSGRKRTKLRDARQVAVQTSDKALKNGELDVDKFIKAREWEIKALEAGMKGARKLLATRAHQTVPRDMRRRTASHNVKRVPKRLRARAQKEMAIDNTPTVNSRTRKPQTTRSRLRLETARRLEAQALKARARSKAAKQFRAENIAAAQKLFGRKSRPKQDSTVADGLSAPPKPAAKFRKRQVNKTWLPTHIYHSKRAHMTLPKEPLWRFAIPLTPTEKCYRPTHRATTIRGAVAWDTSYMATIELEGREENIHNVLTAIGVGTTNVSTSLWEKAGSKWRNGKRAWEGWLFEKDQLPIAPVMIVWCVLQPCAGDTGPGLAERPQAKLGTSVQKVRRKLFIRVHPSAFLQIWDLVLPLAKREYPVINVQDLRFEIGSIEITGPSSTEALLGALVPTARPTAEDTGPRSPEATWITLNGLTNPASLPLNALLGFTISDPRLRHPPLTIAPPPASLAEETLLRILSQWPPDQSQTRSAIFERNARVTAGRRLPSQKAINRRKGLALAGAYPDPLPTDPKIPVLLVASRPSSTGQGKWTVLLPWKCVLPVWYTLMYYPLSTGANVRFGGLDEMRQVAFEAGLGWFPADYPGTKAGWEWEFKEREERKTSWEKRPKGKRIEWESVDLGEKRKGEIGLGWACDWERLILGRPQGTEPKADSNIAKASESVQKPADRLPEGPDDEPTKPSQGIPPLAIHQLERSQAEHILRRPAHAFSPGSQPADLSSALMTVKITLLTRGTPKTCARIYRLPTTNSALRQTWINLHRAFSNPKPTATTRTKPLTKPSTAAQSTPEERRRALAAALLAPPATREGPPQAGDPDYPVVPGEEDLIGYVTTGNFSLGEGRGIGIGCLVVGKLVGEGGGKGPERRLCVVREAGMALGRLARWEVV